MYNMLSSKQMTFTSISLTVQTGKDGENVMIYSSIQAINAVHHIHVVTLHLSVELKVIDCANICPV